MCTAAPISTAAGAAPALASAHAATHAPALVDQSSAQCCHCGYRNSHAPDCPFKG